MNKRRARGCEPSIEPFLGGLMVATLDERGGAAVRAKCLSHRDRQSVEAEDFCLFRMRRIGVGAQDGG